MTEAEVLDALRIDLGISDGSTGSEWSMLTQVAVGGRRLDALVQHRESGTRVAYEVKTSRADMRNETNEKRSVAERVAHLCYYLTPPNLIRDFVFPPRWGLVEVGATDPVVAPSAFNREPDSEALLATVLARASDDAEAIRRAERPSTYTVTLLRRVDDLMAQVGNAQHAKARERERAHQARSALLAADGMQQCADCGLGVTWKATGSPAFRWVHLHGPDEARCRAARAEKARLAAEGRTGARYLSVDPPPVRPLALRDA